TLDPDNRVRLELDAPRIDPETNLLLEDHFAERRVEQMLVNRKIRDANFRNHVLDAYENTCAVTGLRIVNGGGKAEAQAAHIWSVAGGGPDIVQNGVALSATAHWLFDRHLITFDDNLCLLRVSKSACRAINRYIRGHSSLPGIASDLLEFDPSSDHTDRPNQMTRPTTWIV
ncbi:hypothetical protein LTR94_031657, partial [Friedmanniomyces endolithicus]